MSLAHDPSSCRRSRWVLAAVAPALLAGGLIGCQHRSRPSGPFSDVTGRARTQSVQALAASDAKAPAKAEAPAAAPAAPVRTVLAAQPDLRRPPEPPVNVPAGPANVPAGPAAEQAGLVPPPRLPEREPIPAIAGLPARATIALNLAPGGVLTREWPTSVSSQPSGDVLAGPSYYPRGYRSATRSDWVGGIMEPAEFLIDTVLLPVRAVFTPPWAPVVYSPAGPAAQESLTIGQPWLPGAPELQVPAQFPSRLRVTAGTDAKRVK